MENKYRHYYIIEIVFWNPFNFKIGICCEQLDMACYPRDKLSLIISKRFEYTGQPRYIRIQIFGKVFEFPRTYKLAKKEKDLDSMAVAGIRGAKAEKKLRDILNKD